MRSVKRYPGTDRRTGKPVDFVVTYTQDELLRSCVDQHFENLDGEIIEIPSRDYNFLPDDILPGGPSFFGSYRCRSNSLNAGGTKPFCTCDTCF